MEAEMLDNQTAPMGHNNPPDPIDEALAPYGDWISEAENWLDGGKVETEDQMKAVDAIIKEIRSARSAVEKARKVATDPLHKAWKDEVARWKPTEDDLERLQKGLAAAVDTFKRRLAAEKAEAERKAREAAEAAAREAHEAAMRASDTDIEAQRAAAAATAAAEAAMQKAKQAARANDVKGLRTVTRFEIEDHRAALHWIATNDRDAITAFIEDYVRRNHKTMHIAGVKVWQEKEAY